jgi:hypothetical protein
MMFGRKPKTKEEKDFWALCYKIGMKNGWCNGEFDKADGNFIVEEDRLNKNSVLVIDDLPTLKKFFAYGNWCLGQTVIYGNLAFMQQVNGGDEWLAIRKTAKGAESFESITFGPMCRNYKDSEDWGYLDPKERTNEHPWKRKLPTSHYANQFKEYVAKLSNIPDDKLHNFEYQ